MTARRRIDHGPIVGITAGHQPHERYSLHEGYVDAIAAVGGFPLILPVGKSIDSDYLIAQVMRCDAVLVSGGDDVDPELSKLADPSEAHDSDRVRDELEIAMIHAALGSGRPVLGICRGIQILAVAQGGSLIGDVESAGFDKHDFIDQQYEAVHEIRVEPGSLAAEIVGGLDKVNSAHHQAVAAAPPGMRATAWAPDGCIEAIEGPGSLGLQWHPERMIASDERFLPAFQWLIS